MTPAENTCGAVANEENLHAQPSQGNSPNTPISGRVRIVPPTARGRRQALATFLQMLGAGCKH
eukprot:CAMPEP_0195073268 /NCGR_PEP_ID=MMETSP0448-20130528/16637_1 /TAXON_ID=66468 /ORGANISM="Heterocapsa triquestra, Strain CCMP 448" /LENGTH=62 /DNA_ID=CAMNT_0040105355 /DNA_START=156 /DNA_END=341 /DNA_ORIENTATION=-